jgi:hypothetical protein
MSCSYSLALTTYFIALVHGFSWQLSMFKPVQFHTIAFSVDLDQVLAYSMLLSYQMVHMLLQYVARKHNKLFHVLLVAGMWTTGTTISVAGSMVLEDATIDIHTLIFTGVNSGCTCAALALFWHACAASRP